MKQLDGDTSTPLPKGLTVSQSKTIATALSKGESVERAAEQAGLSLSELRKQGRLSETISELLKRADLSDMARRKLGRARLVELSMQDHDLKVALGAAKVISGEGTPQVALQFNQQNLVTDPEVIESLKSLGIKVGGEDDETTGRQGTGQEYPTPSSSDT